MLVCLWIQSKKALVWGTRVHGEQRVIMLHPVASGCFTKPDTGGQVCQANGREGEGCTGTNDGDSDITVLANTHTYSTHMHKHTPSRVTGMCPRKAGMPGREEAAES